MPSKIEWTQETWNPIAGCTKCSPGCDHCYAERMANRLKYMLNYPQYLGKTNDDGKWTGKVECCDWKLEEPLHWRKPRRIFVCSMSDLFHESVPFDFIMKVLGIMMQTPRHRYQILTKRPERMKQWVEYLAQNYNNFFKCRGTFESIGNTVHLGVSISNQAEADEKIPILLKIPAAIRWLSIEPMLEDIDLTGFKPWYGTFEENKQDRGLYWIVVGGESGPGPRPMHPDWARGIRDQCVAAGVPFFFKQWGNWIPGRRLGEIIWDSTHEASSKEFRDVNNHSVFQFSDGQYMFRSRSKKTAGRLLDGREWNQYPER